MTRPEYLAPFVLALLAASGAGPSCAPSGERPVRVGSKKFTESVVLAEVLTQMARAQGAPAVHRAELGGTRILFDALVAGEIDAYPEYTGTLREELVPDARPGDDGLAQSLATRKLRMSAPLGFNNTYAIGMKQAVAERLGIRNLSDLAQRPELRFGFSNEFLHRADGWPSLQTRYALPQEDVRGLDHSLAYRAIEAGQVDATDLYSTDAEIKALGLRVLEDDLHYFPEYEAVVLFREGLPERAPHVLTAWGALAGRIDEAQMVALNARAKLDRIPESRVAAEFLEASMGVAAPAGGTGEQSRAARVLHRTLEHLALVGVSLAFAVLLGVPLGIASVRHRRVGQMILGVVGLVQTVPSLALLVFMIPLFGIGTQPAIVALFLYSLLPIVRGTHAGLVNISAELQDAARALGLPSQLRLWRIELPLASPSILSGIQTSAVINIGTATLGALIGAGGYGQPILTGIRLADVALILEGAVPAAVLAVLAHGLFSLLDRVLVPKGLRLQRGVG